MPPKRSRSHQLEDISRNKFEALLPASWVVRPKSHDYGIDCEVEIFEANGDATGFTFLVQLRATDDKLEAQKINLKVSQMDYFLSLTLPTAVVRYCSATDSFFWQWHFNIAAVAKIKERQKTFTHYFSDYDVWSETTPFAIWKTLRTRRLLESYPTTEPVEIRLAFNALSSDGRFTLEQAIENLISSSKRTLAKYSGRDTRLVVDVYAAEALLSVRIDSFASLTFNKPIYTQDEIVNSVGYSLSAIFKRHGLIYHADQIARKIVESGSPHYSRFIALEVCRALGTDLRLSVKLAIQNEIHVQQDKYYREYFNFLLLSPQDESHRDEAMDVFLAAALKAAHLAAPSTAAAVHYSWGNYLRVRVNYLAAIRHFNFARKLRPEYMESDYFLQELGASMFGCGRYQWAKELYQAALSIRRGPRFELHLGDAMFFNGNLTEAAIQFAEASKTDDHVLAVEANIKLSLCHWLLKWVANAPPERRPGEATKILEKINDGNRLKACTEVIKSFDATDALAHFNLGVHFARSQMPEEAAAHFLVCAFKQSGDLDAWTNALICAWQSKDKKIFESALTSALSLAGHESYSHFRAAMTEQVGDIDLVAAIDAASREIQSMVHDSKINDLTIRDLSDSKFDIVIPL
jgi:tetratricopeptide (TPR) repeat protein